MERIASITALTCSFDLVLGSTINHSNKRSLPPSRKASSAHSILIILGSVSTGVNMIAGIVTRTINALERRMEPEKRAKGHMVRSAVAALVFTAGVWAISQVGLMAIIKKGYAYLGYAGCISVSIPFILSMLHIGPFGKAEAKQ